MSLWKTKPRMSDHTVKHLFQDLVHVTTIRNGDIEFGYPLQLSLIKESDRKDANTGSHVLVFAGSHRYPLVMSDELFPKTYGIFTDIIVDPKTILIRNKNGLQIYLRFNDVLIYNRWLNGLSKLLSTYQLREVVLHLQSEDIDQKAINNLFLQSSVLVSLNDKSYKKTYYLFKVVAKIAGINKRLMSLPNEISRRDLQKIWSLIESLDHLQTNYHALQFRALYNKIFGNIDDDYARVHYVDAELSITPEPEEISALQRNDCDVSLQDLFEKAMILPSPYMQGPMQRSESEQDIFRQQPSLSCSYVDLCDDDAVDDNSVGMDFSFISHSTSIEENDQDDLESEKVPPAITNDRSADPRQCLELLSAPEERRSGDNSDDEPQNLSLQVPPHEACSGAYTDGDLSQEALSASHFFMTSDPTFFSTLECIDCGSPPPYPRAPPLLSSLSISPHDYLPSPIAGSKSPLGLYKLPRTPLSSPRSSGSGVSSGLAALMKFFFVRFRVAGEFADQICSPVTDLLIATFFFLVRLVGAVIRLLCGVGSTVVSSSKGWMAGVQKVACDRTQLMERTTLSVVQLMVVVLMLIGFFGGFRNGTVEPAAVAAKPPSPSLRMNHSLNVIADKQEWSKNLPIQPSSAAHHRFEGADCRYEGADRRSPEELTRPTPPPADDSASLPHEDSSISQSLLSPRVGAGAETSIPAACQTLVPTEEAETHIDCDGRSVAGAERPAAVSLPDSTVLFVPFATTVDVEGKEKEDVTSPGESVAGSGENVDALIETVHDNAIDAAVVVTDIENIHGADEGSSHGADEECSSHGADEESSSRSLPPSPSLALKKLLVPGLALARQKASAEQHRAEKLVATPTAMFSAAPAVSVSTPHINDFFESLFQLPAVGLSFSTTTLSMSFSVPVPLPTLVFGLDRVRLGYLSPAIAVLQKAALAVAAVTTTAVAGVSVGVLAAATAGFAYHSSLHSNLHPSLLEHTLEMGQGNGGSDSFTASTASSPNDDKRNDELPRRSSTPSPPSPPLVSPAVVNLLRSLGTHTREQLSRAQRGLASMVAHVGHASNRIHKHINTALHASKDHGARVCSDFESTHAGGEAALMMSSLDRYSNAVTKALLRSTTAAVCVR